MLDKKKHDHVVHSVPEVPEAPAAPTPCAVCGQYEGEMSPVGNTRVHAACAAARPDVIVKVKARS